MLKDSPAAATTAADGADTPRDVVRALADVIGLLEPRLLELWKTTGMTFAQRRVVRRLRGGPRSPGSLAADMGISAPTLTRHLQRLEDGALISRSTDREDRRRVVVELTDAGRRSLADHRVFGGTPLARAAADLTAPQRRELVAGLTRLVKLARDESNE